jgi:hypothetical protein
MHAKGGTVKQMNARDLRAKRNEMKKLLSLAAIVLATSLTQAELIDFNLKAPVSGDGYYRPTTDGSHDWPPRIPNTMPEYQL